MEATLALKFQCPAWLDSGNFLTKPTGALRCNGRLRGKDKIPVLISAHLKPQGAPNRHRSVSVEASSSFKNFPATWETGSFHAPSDEALILKKKSLEIEPYLNGCCIYLVGMMGSGKTTVGMILSQVLGYSFCDSDSVVEEDANGTSVAEIFKLHGEGFFRDKETEVLGRLSLMHRIVISTGGGAVIRPINWKYMQKGVSVWLDVPLEALAERIAAAGTSSRPLVHNESGDAYLKTLKRLSSLWEERGEAYAKANARVSLENVATKLGLRDVSNLTPTAIAIEALEQIETCLKEGWRL